LFYLLTEME